MQRQPGQRGPKTNRRNGQVTVVSCDNNNLYHQRLTKADRDKAKAEEIDLMALSSIRTISSILVKSFDNLVLAVLRLPLQYQEQPKTRDKLKEESYFDHETSNSTP